MFHVLNRQLEQVDRRINPDAPVDAVQLGNIAKTFERLVELRTNMNSSRKEKPESDAAVALREVIAQNVARLNEQS